MLTIMFCLRPLSPSLLAAWLIFMGIFTYFLVPETKGIPIEDIESKFRQHWFWGKVMRKHDHDMEGPGGKYNDVGKLKSLQNGDAASKYRKQSAAAGDSDVRVSDTADY